MFIEYQTPDFEDYTIRIFNTLGQLMYQKTLSPPPFSTKKEEIDVRNWAAGFYFIVLERGKEQVYRKFIVQ